MSYFNTEHTSSVACTIAFPPLQTIFSHRNNNNNKTAICNESFSSSPPLPLFNAITPPKYPSYLKYTGYADIVLQQYHDRKAKKLTTTTNDYRLPQYWCKRQNNTTSVHIGLNGYDLTFNNTSGNTTTITLQTNLPIQPQCGIYYFEIRVIQKGLDGNFAIGFSRKNHKLNKLPGCDVYSFGYHGYDGKIYQHDTKGTNYGPTFISGDIIGCCINYATQSAFFTKNGVSLGTAFKSINISELLYPCIGLNPGEKITANFGQEPFVFDIVHHVKSQQNLLIHSTCQQYDVKDIKVEMDQLVISYLLQQGYTDTATALLNNIQHVKQHDYLKSMTMMSEDQLCKNKLRKLIMAGLIDSAIEQTHSYYPGLLDQYPDVLFQLKTRKFLDILIDDISHITTTSDSSSSSSSSDDTDDDTLSTYSSRSSRTQSFNGYHDLHHQILYEEEEEEKPFFFGHVNATPLSVAASGRRLSWAAIAAPSSSIESVNEQEMYTTRRKSMSSFNSSNRIRRDSFDFLEEDTKRMTKIRKAMHYGHQLQEEYQHQSKYFNKLLELFTLFDYSDPISSPMSHLLNITLRDQVASQLITAIHKYKHQAEDSALELIYKQSKLIQTELVHAGHGKATLMNINHYFVGK